jgi:ATP-dependent Zn protease
MRLFARAGREVSYLKTQQILAENAALLEEMSLYLLEEEVLDGEQLDSFLSRAQVTQPAELFEGAGAVEES